MDYFSEQSLLQIIDNLSWAQHGSDISPDEVLLGLVVDEVLHHLLVAGQGVVVVVAVHRDLAQVSPGPPEDSDEGQHRGGLIPSL